MLRWDRMQSSFRARPRSTLAALAMIAFSLPLLDCASPGPPRAPSLRLPESVRNLSAARVGDAVELRFTVPTQSSDGFALRGTAVLGKVCRAEESGPCRPLGTLGGMPSANAAGQSAFTMQLPGGGTNRVTLRDDLTPALRSGPARLLSYRVEFFNASGRSDGPSAPAFAVAGAAVPPVVDLQAQGSRQGVLLRWQPAATKSAGEVLLLRERLVTTQPQVGPVSRGEKAGTGGRKSSSAGPDLVWLQAKSDAGEPEAVPHPGAAADRFPDRMLDDSARPGDRYQYTAQRREIVRLQGRMLERRSELSGPLLVVFADTFPPAAPTGLTAAGFGNRGHYAVDLIWEPAEDPAVVGYVVERVVADAQGKPLGAPAVLNAAPLATPALHDSTANPALRYRYSVVSVDAKGLRSAAAAVGIEAQSGP